MNQHLTVVGILHIAWSALMLLTAVFVAVLLVVLGVVSDDAEAMKVLSVVAGLIGFYLFVTCLPGLIGGIGILRGSGWARILLLVVAVINLVNVPFGTMLGVYTLWVLTHEETRRILR